MSRERFAIADTCFLIDWARYRRRDLLFQLFSTVFVPEQVLGEIVSERVVAWVSRLLSEDKLALYTPTREEELEARRLVEESRANPRMAALDMPEALCLAAGRSRGYTVLTENRGALLAPRLVPGYENVRVWRALEILEAAVLEGLVAGACEDPKAVFDEYQEDTLHLFPSRALGEAVERVRRACRKR